MSASQYVLHSSREPMANHFDFSTKQFCYIPDSNGSNYPNGTITFDLASLSNSGRYISWQESHLVIPLIMNLNCATAGVLNQDYANVWSASLKNGIYHILNSMSVEITNNQVVNLTNFSNYPIHFKTLTSMSQDTQNNFGSTLHFAKDSANSFSYQNALNGTGIGECNNVITATLFNPNAANNASYGTGMMSQNTGRLARMMNTSFNVDTGLAAGTPSPSATYQNAQTCNTNYKNYCTISANNITYYITATIPMRIIHDIFDKLPLCRGMYTRLVLNTNCNSQAVMTMNAAATQFTTVAVTSPNNVFPCQISPIGGGLKVTSQPAAPVAQTLTLSLSIAKNQQLNFSHALTQCRIYACMYEMTPTMESSYLSAVPTKRILYNDYLNFQSLNIPAGQMNSQILSVGVARPRYLLGIPTMSSQINGSSIPASSTFTAVVGGQQSAFAPASSPFSSVPATCSPLMRISNFNVLLSGVALYQENINYSFQIFQNEIRSTMSLNGGIDLSLSSGLIDEVDYTNLYSYIFVDLSRQLNQSTDNIARSIQVIYTNNSLVSQDINWFVLYERELCLSTSTGALVI